MYKEECDVSINGISWVDTIRTQHDSAIKDQAQAVDNLAIPTQRNGDAYGIEIFSDEQKCSVYDDVDTVMKFLTSYPNYKPMRATITGSGGTGKAFIINTIISMVRTLTCNNDTVQIDAPSGAVVFNVQGLTIHNLLGVRVNHPKKGMNEPRKARLLEKFGGLLVLIIDERSMIRSKVLAAAERNTHECI